MSGIQATVNEEKTIIDFELVEGLQDPMTAAGDLITRNAANQTVRLPAGAVNQVVGYVDDNGATVLAPVTPGGQSGYELTGGFAERFDGQSAGNDIGSNVQYTNEMANNGTWKRFGFSSERQVANDVAYFPTPDEGFDQTKGLFGGMHMPEGVNKLFDHDNTDLEAAVTTGDLQYTEAAGTYWLEDCNVGDLVKIRFSFNAIPQIANSTVEVALIWATRDDDGNVTFTFPLTTQPIYYGTGTQGQTFLNRVELSAYMASNEDVNARLLPAIRCNNEILLQPLSTLISIVR